MARNKYARSGETLGVSFGRCQNMAGGSSCTTQHASTLAHSSLYNRLFRLLGVIEHFMASEEGWQRRTQKRKAISLKSQRLLSFVASHS